MLLGRNFRVATKREFQNPKNRTQESVRRLEGVPKGGDQMEDQYGVRKDSKSTFGARITG